MLFYEWRTERQFRRAQEEHDKIQISVLRDNRTQQIPIIELVVGDLCIIKSGKNADGLIVQANDLKVDQSPLTEEPDLIKKNENEDVALLSGTQLMEGSGLMVVVGVGLNSQTGIILSLLTATTNNSKD
ncbi:unnamed protein product [Rotaria sp. Silwood1]|nr:unnamed protein product [Rotaria sp. Silwood1]CAF3533799.1 unnamed protein product [Rotaria sp. Silwood1]CAF3580009.1 unnamed protein product [Rotaria sp. Silwood1]CAF3608612.1 unnamed protein product [Rotaria sp. Silwood1]CAF4666694.1 unnamed protein product [Rotaria sp. Silwood1]